MDRARLKEMGTTQILNTAEVKKNLRVLFGIPRKEALLGQTNIGVKYYKAMNISYYGVPVTEVLCSTKTQNNGASGEC